MQEVSGDNGAVVIISNNQETRYIVSESLNSAEEGNNLNIMMESKE